MRLTHFFINRPRFAAVLSMFVTLLGLGALAILPVAQYPEVVPPTVQVTTTYPGASAETVARTVATPLEQEINGVENMLDLSSQLQVYLGSQYVNDFNYLGRTYKVVTQADGEFRRTSQDIARLKARNTSGEMVPIGTVAQLKDHTIPYRVPRHNLFPAAEVQGVAAPGVASGTALHRMEELAHQVLPKGIAFEWTELAYQQQERGTPTLLVFGAAALFVFLVLVAQYESWKLPLAIVLVVPMCLLASVTGLLARGLPIDILAQIGFVVLVGLAAKNAILIVEFARQKQDNEGATPGEAAVHAARTRLRPILMTSFAFILGVAPLAVATGAGAEMRQSLGTAVLSGMIGVTCFGLLFTPAFYTFIRKLGREERP